MNSPATSLFQEKIKVINVGLPGFAEDLRHQGVPVIHVQWAPPAGGNSRILTLLDRVSAWQRQVKDMEGGN